MSQGPCRRPRWPRGWDDIAEWTDGIALDQIDALRSARELEPAYPLLHALVGRSLRDFLVRAAALESLLASDLPAFSKADLDHVLWWLGEEARDATLKVLRQSGWLRHDPAEGTSVTDAGRWAFDILSFLHRRLRESELLPTLAGVEYALRIGVDPVHQVLSMRSRLVALRQEIEDARASHSEVVLRRAALKLDEATRLSAQIRAAMDRVPVDHVAARKVVREVHDLLSRLHGAGAELHAAITEVGRQYLHLTHGLTIEQIVGALMRKTRPELAAAGRDALLPALRPPKLLTTEVVASAAEQHFLRERQEAEPLVWDEPPEAPRADEQAAVPAEVLALLADLDEIARSNGEVALAALVPRASAGESFLRASLLPLAGDRGHGEGVAGQLGALTVELEVSGEGWPEPLEGAALAALTPGVVRRRGDRRDG
jgi:hypothetical protein